MALKYQKQNDNHFLYFKNKLINESKNDILEDEDQFLV